MAWCGRRRRPDVTNVNEDLDMVRGVLISDSGRINLVCGVDGLFPTANGSINHPVLRQRGGVADLRDKNAGEPTRQ